MKALLFKRQHHRWRRLWMALVGAVALLLPLEAAMQPMPKGPLIAATPAAAQDPPANGASSERGAASSPRDAASQAGPPDTARDETTQQPELRPRMRPELAPNPPTEEELRPRMQPDKAEDAPLPPNSSPAVK
jgi:hypothetical protein